MNDNIRERIKASAGPKAEKAGAHPAQTAFSSLLEPGKRSAESSKRDRVIDLVAKIFTAAGWQVEKRPRTQDPTVDPLLVDIDLLATRNGSAMLGDVSYTEGGATFDDIQRPSAIIQAVWLLAEHRDLDPDDVGAGLIIVDARPDQKIGEICERLGITLILLDGTRVDEFLGIPEEDSEARARKAKELLNLPFVEEAIDV